MIFHTKKKKKERHKLAKKEKSCQNQRTWTVNI